MALKPTVITNPHPLLGDGRQYYYSTFVKGETLGQYCLRNHVCIPRSNVAVFVNGVRLIDDWERFIPEQGDRIIFRTMAYGRGGRKIASIVAMIALAVAAPHLAAYMGFTQGTVAFGLATGAIMMAGSLLINAILPPIKPAQLGNKEKEQSPTYGINAGRNQISQYSPMIVVFGRHKVVPFHASKPYTTFAGNDQYLSQAFHFGLQTDLDIQQLKIGKTLIGDYRNVQIQRSLANGDLSLVAGNVDTLDGYEFGYADGWTVRTSPLDTEFIDVDIAATLYNINDSGDEREQVVTIEAQYSKKGLNQWKPLGGNYTSIASHYWSLGYWVTETGGGRDTEWSRQKWVQVRFGTINPADHTDGELEEVVTNRIYDYLSRETTTTTTRYIWRWVAHPAAGVIKQPWQGIAPSPYTTHTGTGVQEIKGRNPQQPSRVTMSASVARGEYDVRVRKVSADISTSRSSNKTSVAQLRFTQADDADYDGQCRMAVRIKASSQLHGAIDELSAICSASCLVWKNGTWVNEKTSNPAWWYLHWALGRYDKQFNRLYGEGLPWSRIDVEGIKAWAAFCDAKQLRFNWVLDRKMSIEDVYYTIARAGRASVTWQTGKRGVIFDSASIPVTTMITPANIKAGSYEYTYINTQVADEIIINFYNAAKDYEKDVVRQRVPGAPEFNNPITLDLEGCTNVSQAGREANLLAASQHFHRKQHRWEMDVEGMLAVRGDVVEFSHDLNNWGQSGRLLSVSGNSLVLDGYVQGVASGWLSLRSPNNKIAYLRTNGSGNTDTLTVIGSFPAGFVPPTEETAIDYMWQYNPLKLAGKKLHIKKVEPKDSNTFAFEAIEYIPEYYASEGNPYRYVENTSSVANQSLIRVLGVTSSERNINEARGTVDVHFAWTLSEKCPANVIVYLNGDALRTSVGITSNQIVVNAREGDLIDIEIHPDKRGRAVESYRYQHLVVGKLDILPAPTGLEVVGEFTKKSLKVKWNRVINAVGYRVAIYTNGALLRMLNVGNVLTYEYTAADMQLDGGTGRTVMVRVKALGAKNVESGWAEISATNPQIGQLQGVEVEGLVKSIMFTCTKPSDEDFAGYLFWISDNENFTPTLSNVHFDGDFNQYFFERHNRAPLVQTDYYIWAAGYDTFGKDSLNISPSYKVRPLILQLDPQSIANEMIKDGALSINKFAENIKPPVVVPTMPPTANANDRVILESTGRMYRYTFDGIWKPLIEAVSDIDSLPASIIDGALQLEQLPAIPTTKLEGEVEASQIAANAIGANHLAANIIESGHVKARSLTGDRLDINSVTALELAADSVTFGKVAAGAIGADQIQANAITTNHMVIRGANLIPNSDFSTGDFTGWRPYQGGLNCRVLPATSGGTQTYATTSPTINFCRCDFGPDFTYPFTNGVFAFTKAYSDVGADKDNISVQEGETYYLSIDMFRNSTLTPGTFRIICYFHDNSNTLLTSVIAVNLSMMGGESRNVWSTYEGKVVVPAGATRMSVYVYSHLTEAPSSGGWFHIFWTNLRCLRMMDSSLVVDGAIKTQHIVTGTLHGNVLAANTVNGDRVIANTIHGNRLISNTVTSTQMTTGTITAASGIIANLAVQRIKIADGSVTVGSKWTPSGHLAEGVGGVSWVQRWSVNITSSPWAIFFVRIKIVTYGGGITNRQVRVLAGSTQVAIFSTGNISNGTSESDWFTYVAPASATISVQTLNAAHGSASFTWSAEIVALQTFK